MPDGTVIDRDGCLRPQTSLEGLAALKPAFGADGTVAAGTASPLTDGAVAVLVTSAEFARAHGLDVIARVKSTAIAGVEPEYMGMPCDSHSAWQRCRSLGRVQGLSRAAASDQVVRL